MAHRAGLHHARGRAPAEPELVPSGDYRARIVDAVIERVSRTSDFGRCLKLTWQIEAGPFDNRLVRQRLSLWAENMSNLDKVIAIANAQFAAIRAATGRLVPQDVDELRDIACRIRVGIRSDPSGRHGPRNEVRAVRAVGAAPASSHDGDDDCPS